MVKKIFRIVLLTAPLFSSAMDQQEPSFPCLKFLERSEQNEKMIKCVEFMEVPLINIYKQNQSEFQENSYYYLLCQIHEFEEKILKNQISDPEILPQIAKYFQKYENDFNYPDFFNILKASIDKLLNEFYKFMEDIKLLNFSDSDSDHD